MKNEFNVKELHDALLRLVSNSCTLTNIQHPEGVDDCPQYIKDSHILCNLIQREVPEEPVKAAECPCTDGSTISYFICPDCREIAGLYDNTGKLISKGNYCSNCGTKLDWSQHDES